MEEVAAQGCVIVDGDLLHLSAHHLECAHVGDGGVLERECQRVLHVGVVLGGRPVVDAVCDAFSALLVYLGIEVGQRGEFVEAHTERQEKRQEAACALLALGDAVVECELRHDVALARHLGQCHGGDGR